MGGCSVRLETHSAPFSRAASASFTLHAVLSTVHLMRRRTQFAFLIFLILCAAPLHPVSRVARCICLPHLWFSQRECAFFAAACAVWNDAVTALTRTRVNATVVSWQPASAAAVLQLPAVYRCFSPGRRRRQPQLRSQIRCQHLEALLQHICIADVARVGTRACVHELTRLLECPVPIVNQLFHPCMPSNRLRLVADRRSLPSLTFCNNNVLAANERTNIGGFVLKDSLVIQFLFLIVNENHESRFVVLCANPSTGAMTWS